MNFDDLQKSWKEQPLSMPDDTAAIPERVATKWRKQQRTALWSNVATTLGFAVVLCVFAWVYVSFREGRTLLFGGSILFMTLLLLVYLWAMWKGIVLKKRDMSLPGNEYVAQYITTLQWRRTTITTYTAVYLVLLWLALMCYMLDVLTGASLSLSIGAPLATTAYVLFVYFATRKKQRKQLASIDELITDLSKLREEE